MTMLGLWMLPSSGTMFAMMWWLIQGYEQWRNIWGILYRDLVKIILIPNLSIPMIETSTFIIDTCFVKINLIIIFFQSKWWSFINYGTCMIIGPFIKKESQQPAKYDDLDS